MERFGVFIERALGLLMLLFGYCSEPPTSNVMLNQFITSPCAVSCGLLSFLFVPTVLRVSGIVAVALGLMQIVSLYFSTVLVIPLTVLFKFRGWLTGLFGGGGSSGGGGASGMPIGSGNFSLSTAIALIAIGALLAGGDEIATSVASSVASMLSGLLLSGMAFILTTAAGVLGIGVCGAG